MYTHEMYDCCEIRFQHVCRTENMRYSVTHNNAATTHRRNAVMEIRVLQCAVDYVITQIIYIYIYMCISPSPSIYMYIIFYILHGIHTYTHDSDAGFETSCSCDEGISVGGGPESQSRQS
jgi:hypothetical protein